MDIKSLNIGYLFRSYVVKVLLFQTWKLSNDSVETFKDPMLLDNKFTFPEFHFEPWPQKLISHCLNRCFRS